MVGVREITRRPPLRSALLAGGIGAVVPLAALAGGATPAAASAAGVALLAAGVGRGRRRFIDAGALVAFLGVVFAGTTDAGVAPVLAGTVGTVLAWDVGGNAVSLGAQLGREAETTRVELLHALAGAAVGVASAIVGLALYVAGPTHQPVTTLFVLLVAGALLTAALNR